MRVSFRTSFGRDLRKLKDAVILQRVHHAIEVIEAAVDLGAIPGLKKLEGYERYYRVRVGDYRLGMAAEADAVDLIRCLPRRDFYRKFP